MNALLTHINHDFNERKGEFMNYLAAIVCVIALVLINIFGTESKEINTILSTAIMALVWGGVQRRQTEGENQDSKKTSGRGR